MSSSHSTTNRKYLNECEWIKRPNSCELQHSILPKQSTNALRKQIKWSKIEEINCIEKCLFELSHNNLTDKIEEGIEKMKKILCDKRCLLVCRLIQQQQIWATSYKHPYKCHCFQHYRYVILHIHNMHGMSKWKRPVDTKHIVVMQYRCMLRISRRSVYPKALQLTYEKRMCELLMLYGSNEIDYVICNRCMESILGYSIVLGGGDLFLSSKTLPLFWIIHKI